MVAEELLLLDDLDDLTVDRELLRVPEDRTELFDRFPEERVTDVDLLIPLLTVLEIVFLIRLEILDPLLRLSGWVILLLTRDTAR